MICSAVERNCLISSSQKTEMPFDTLEPGILRIAVTNLPEPGSLFDQTGQIPWTFQFFRRFEEAYNTKIVFEIIPFDHSWDLASQDRVDIVATGVSVLPERRNEGSAFSDPYLQVIRGLRINEEDTGRFHSIEDMEGAKIGAVNGTMGLKAVYKYPPKGAEIIGFDTWDELYAAFNDRKIDAISEGFYVSVDEPLHDDDSTIFRLNEEVEENPEQLAFVVRDKSSGLLETLNHFLHEVGFPIQP